MALSGTVHRDFRFLPRYTFHFNGLMIGAVNLTLRLQRLFFRPPTGVLVDRIVVPGLPPMIEFTKKGYTGAEGVIVYCHGGGFSCTYALLHLKVCAHYAKETGAKVILVDYRLSGKHPAPAQLEDCVSAFRWVRERASGGSRVLLAGDSVGGCLAAGAQVRAAEQGFPADGLMLIYPALDHRNATESAKAALTTPMWNYRSNGNMWAHYLRGLPDTKSVEPALSPATLNDLSVWPRTYIETAEVDPLRDEGIKFAERLHAAGRGITLNKTAGTVHGFDLVEGSKITQDAIAQRVLFLRSATASGELSA